MNSDRYNRALKIQRECHAAYAKRDMNRAVELWTQLYELYEDIETRAADLMEQHTVMQLFTDEEVFGITDYYKKKHGYA